MAEINLVQNEQPFKEAKKGGLKWNREKFTISVVWNWQLRVPHGVVSAGKRGVCVCVCVMQLLAPLRGVCTHNDII